MKNNKNISLPRAVILPFPRKRGRPPLHRPSIDLGTPELIRKRQLGETTETLDLCLERGLITQQQHWCGIHFRWLYTLRFGAAGVRAIDPTHFGGRDISSEDPQWRQAREEDYNRIIQLLSERGYGLLLLNICVYNERPIFLKTNQIFSKKNATETEKLISIFRQSFDFLEKTIGSH